jgi:hypothetical protein
VPGTRKAGTETKEGGSLNRWAVCGSRFLRGLSTVPRGTD